MASSQASRRVETLSIFDLKLEAGQSSMALDLASFLLGLCLPLLLALATLLIKSLRGIVKVNSKPRPGGGFKVVVTGGTRGLGLELARSFLELGDSVVINSRYQASIDEVFPKLQQDFPGSKALGVAGCVSKAADVDALANTAVEELGRIDIFVCNAALSAKTKMPVAKSSPQEMEEIVRANLLGALLCSRAAMSRMLEQPEGGKVFLVDGAGSRGQPTPGNAAYGATKRALVQLKASLAAEVKGTNVSVHIVSPGMVATDLLLRYANNSKSAKFINILSEDPATVAAWLVPRMRGVTKNGSYISFLGPASVAYRFLTARRRRGRFIPEGAAGTSSTDAGYAPLPTAAAAAHNE